MEETKVEVPAKFKDIVATIEAMSVLDLHELVKVLEAKFGVSAQAAAAPAAAGASEEAEVKSAFTVELTAAGEQKIAVMKVVKEVLALGLKEAKDLVDGAPKVLKETSPKAEAEEVMPEPTKRTAKKNVEPAPKKEFNDVLKQWTEEE